MVVGGIDQPLAGGGIRQLPPDTGQATPEEGRAGGLMSPNWGAIRQLPPDTGPYGPVSAHCRDARPGTEDAAAAVCSSSLRVAMCVGESGWAR